MKFRICCFAIVLSFFSTLSSYGQVEVEPNESYVDANEFVIPATLSGRIYKATGNHNGDIDRFKVRVPQGGVIYISAINAPSLIELGMHVQDSLYAGSTSYYCGYTIFQAGLFTPATVIVPPGIYYVSFFDLNHNQNDSVNFYEVTVGLNYMDPFEPNQTFAYATTLPTDTDFHASIYGNYVSSSCLTDEDVYRFTPDKSGSLKVSVSNIPATQEIHTLFYRTGSTTQYCKYVSPVVGIDPPEKFYQVVAGQPYYFRVITYPARSDSGTYQLTASLDTFDFAEPNEGCGSAYPIGYNQSYQAKILGLLPENSCSPEKDFYRLMVPENGVIRIIMEDVPADIRAVMVVYNDNCSQLQSSTASQIGALPLPIERSVCAGEEIIVEIRDYGSSFSEDPYQFRVELDLSDPNECNQTIGTASLVAACDTIMGKVDPVNATVSDIDYFKFTPQGDSCRIEFVQAPGAVKLQYGVKNAFGTQLSGFPKTASAAGNLPPAATFAVIPGEDYFPYVQSSNGAGSQDPYRFVIKDSLCLTIGIEEILLNQSLRVFPNPSNGRFMLELNGRHFDNAQVTVLDMLGKIQKNFPIHAGSNEVELPYCNGIYYLQISVSKAVVYKKIIVSK